MYRSLPDIHFCFSVFIILNILAWLAGCATGGHLAPVQDKSQTISNKINYHIVSQGETLFAIAWRYGIDYKKLAGYNGIKSPYRIYPGQKLKLTSSSVVAASTSAQPVKPAVLAAPTSSSRSKTTTSVTQPRQTIDATGNDVLWQWPHNGRVSNRFTPSEGLNQGIDIAGGLGEPVFAAGSGRVVYSGSGLRGYGNLLIIKHNDIYLSAYAHNRKLLVKEGAYVKAGQQIAEMGSSGTDKTKLHFEIRRDGTPVDPMKFLPVKSGAKR